MSSVSECMQVACDAIQADGYSRQNDIELAEIFFRDPKVVKFLLEMQVVIYKESKGHNGSAYYGRWEFLFKPHDSIMIWRLEGDTYNLQVYDHARVQWGLPIPFSKKEEMIEFAQKHLKIENGCYFQSQTETKWEDIGKS